MKQPVKHLFMALALSVGLSHAQIAFDTASNYDVFTPWSNGSNQGTGFSEWAFDSFDGGHFLGPAAAQGPNNAPLDTVNQSFGMWTLEGVGFATASRELNAPLQEGEVFSFSIAFSFDNGQRGFNLNFAETGLFNFNVNDQGYSWSGGGTAAATPWPGVREDGVLVDFAFTRSGGNVLFNISSAQDTNLNTSGSFSAANGIDNFEFYVSGAGGDPGGNFYFNNLQVIPEPTSVLLLLGGLGLIAAWKRRQR